MLGWAICTLQLPTTYNDSQWHTLCNYSTYCSLEKHLTYDHQNHFHWLLQQDGVTPLFIASEKEHTSVVKLLLEAKAKTDIQDKVSLPGVIYSDIECIPVFTKCVSVFVSSIGVMTPWWKAVTLDKMIIIWIHHTSFYIQQTTGLLLAGNVLDVVFDTYHIAGAQRTMHGRETFVACDTEVFL